MNSQDTLTSKGTDVPFALYDAFTDVPYSGSQAAVVLQASDITQQQRAKIAREIGAPATAFVDEVSEQRVKVQFYSTVMELPMCGHGTVCLVTRLIDTGLLSVASDSWQSAVLDLPKGEATVEYRSTSSGRVEIMLDVATPQFVAADINLPQLLDLLDIDQSAVASALPVEVASADFVHLCLPLQNLEAMGNLKPDMSGVANFCIENGLETIASFSIEATDDIHHLHVRDFCPAVGVAESAAAGTTNAALAVYLLRNGCVQAASTGSVIVKAEQGIEMGRPSEVTTRIQTNGSRIERLQVGGVATRIIEGVLNIGSHT